MSDLTREQAGKLIRRRHGEWLEFEKRWRWLMDSYEGGQRYRDAVYGTDRRGMPVRNLVMHKREYPDPKEIGWLQGNAIYPAGLATGAANPTATANTSNVDMAQYANDSDYELRRARTPVPTFVREAVECHLGKVYKSEPKRDGPDALKEWWGDVDGLGTSIGDWMESLVAPLFLVLGQLDVIVDHPPAPQGARVETKADSDRLGLGRAVASYILPENMLWWRLDERGRYAEAVVQEFDDSPGYNATDGAQDLETPVAQTRYRHWTSAGWTLYNAEAEAIDSGDHSFGRVPIVRIFDRRKPRCRNVGQSRYEAIAEHQREYYNRDSELILSDTAQAHPLLQGPEDFIQSDGTVPIGPNWLLPKKKSSTGGTVHYEPFECVEFPKDGAESIRTNKHDLRDAIDRDARMTKPAGVRGTGATTVAQSGVSKALDHVEGHDLMVKVSASLGRFEATLAELVLIVLGDGTVDQAALGAIDIVYPTSFDLLTGDDVAQATVDFQGILSASGACPEFEVPALQLMARDMFKGRSQDFYDEVDAAIQRAVDANAATRGQLAEATLADSRVAVPDPKPAGNAEADAEAEGMRLPNYSSVPGYPLRGGM